MRIVPQSVELVWCTENPAKIIELSARTCYKTEAAYDPAKTPDFINRVVHQRHHESVVEHAVASYRIITSRAIANEITRHRIASFSQESTRYCNYGKDRFGNEIVCIMPPGLSDRQAGRWAQTMRYLEYQYLTAIDEGEAPEIARGLLPLDLKTELVMTANFREWMHFLKLRLDKSAHPQIRELAGWIEGSLQLVCPEIFGTSRVVIPETKLITDPVEVAAYLKPQSSS